MESMEKRTVLEFGLSNTSDSAPSSDLGFICCHEVIFPVSIFLSTGMLMSVSGFSRLTIRAIASVAIFISFGKNFLSSSDWRSCAESMRVVMARRTLSVRRRLIASFSLVFRGMMPAIVYIFSNTSACWAIMGAKLSSALISTTPVVAVSVYLSLGPLEHDVAAIMAAMPSAYFFIIVRPCF